MSRSFLRRFFAGTVQCAFLGGALVLGIAHDGSVTVGSCAEATVSVHITLDELVDKTRIALDAGWLRPTVLAFAAAAGLLLVVRGLG